MTTLDRIIDVDAFITRIEAMDRVERGQVRRGWLTKRETLFGPVIYPTFRHGGYDLMEHEHGGRWVEACIESTAGLCAFWPDHPASRGASMGRVFGVAMVADPGCCSSGQFLRLIDSRAEDLVARLRFLIPRVAPHANIAPDWRLLLDDLFAWPDPLSDVRQRWVNDQLDAELGPE